MAVDVAVGGQGPRPAVAATGRSLLGKAVRAPTRVSFPGEEGAAYHHVGGRSGKVTMQAIRDAEPADLPFLHDVERDADRLFASVLGDVVWDASSGSWRAAQPGFLLVTGRPPVGFAHVLDLDGHLHVEQLCVRRRHQRLGLGGALLEAACEEAAARGVARITLMTYADIPWNGPFYTRHGFAELSAEQAQELPFTTRLRAAEEALNLSDHGRRIMMARDLAPSSSRR